MEFFRKAQKVRLRSFWQEFPGGHYRSAHLYGRIDGKEVAFYDDANVLTIWSVEFVDNSDSVLRLKSCFGGYLTASYEPSPPTGCRVVQSRDPLFYSEWEPVMVPTRVKSHPLDSEWEPGCAESEPVMERIPVKSLPPVLYSEQETVMLEHTHFEGTPIKLRTRYGSFLCNGHGSVTHDLPPDITFLWDVVVVEGKKGSATNIDDKASEGGSATDTATNIDNKASEEGSASNIDDKASSATKRCYKTGEGSSVTKSPSGDSGLEVDRVIYCRHFWELKRWFLDSRRKDVLVRGGSGTTALVREVCADVREHFDAIAWISVPQKNDSESILSESVHEEILLQLIFERAAFLGNFLKMTTDHQFPLQQKERCLIVVDNFADERTRKKFEEISGRVKTCRVIFIDRCEMSSSDGQVYHDFEPYDLGNLSFVPWENYLKNFLGKDFYSKRLCQLIVSKCERLLTAVVFVLCNREEQGSYHSSDLINDEWEAMIPSDNLFHEFFDIQQVLKILSNGLHPDEDKNNDKLHSIQRVLEILRTDKRLFCLLYLSIFPENRPLSCKTVSRLWAAEGFHTDLTTAQRFFNFLFAKKCILAVERKREVLYTFQVDKDVREIIVSLSDLRNPVTITSQGSTKWPEEVRYVSVQGTISALDDERNFPLSSISVLGVSSSEDKPTTSEALPLENSKLKHPRVLDLTGAPFQIVPDALFELTEARYLSLRNSSIKVIPGSIGKLTHLQFLDAKHSLVAKLPWQVVRLKKIRHILIYHHERDPLMESYNLIGFKALCRIGGFKNLEKLCFVEADERTLKDLGNLTKLRRLGITKLRKEHGKSLRTSLGKLENLESLNLHAFDEDEILDLHYRTSPPESKSESQTPPSESESQTPPPESLKHLYLHGRLEKLPDWISSLNKLTKIILRWSQLEGDQLEGDQRKADLLATLGNLPMLEELELRRAYDGEQLDFKEGQFPKLKILLLEELEGLRSMSLEKGTLKHLKNLTISRCQWLERIPSGIEFISSIEELTFLDMSHEFYEKVRADAEKEGYKKLLDIAKFRRWRAGHWEPHHEESTDEAHCSHQVESISGIRLEEIYLFK
ncbi:hypothetical protein BT93_L5688 [Corymbia citriodora subsp. variegata]|uniref:NB-ARC domain-containing protein n=1 Tax=Corymbia citriodora subsp. variegata TaxID=360336 RepID=A0A8T0CW73_CORYI|nr:hypothetical protein BT93_L5688 [Corymbia citriodora subsp. variegata]